MDQRAEVGLGNAQVDIPRGHRQSAAHGAQLQLSAGLNRTLFADAGVQFEGEGAVAETVEIADVEIQWPQRQLDVKMHKKIIVCEYCGRIMIDPELAGIEE